MQEREDLELKLDDVLAKKQVIDVDKLDKFCKENGLCFDSCYRILDDINCLGKECDNCPFYKFHNDNMGCLLYWKEEEQNA